MAKKTVFECDHCESVIAEQDCPVVVRINVGVPPGVEPERRDVTDHEMPRLVRELLARQVSRIEVCACCLPELVGSDVLEVVGPGTDEDQDDE